MAAATLPTPIFSGEFRHALDGKNRVTIPSGWRSSEADEFFLMPDRTSMFLRAMPPVQFRAVADKVANNPAVTEKDKAIFLRHFYSKARNATMDKQGRLVLPEDFCEKLHLRGEIVLVGAHDKFELWNREAWDAVTQMEAGTFDRVAELAGL